MADEILTKRVRVIKMGVTVDPCSRTQKIMDWVAKNGDRVDLMSSGNVTFSFTGSTLKVKVEDYENI